MEQLKKQISTISQTISSVTPKSISKIIGLIVLAVLLFLAMIWWQFISPPKTFVPQTLFTIETGSSLEKISQDLYREKYIRSPFFFKLIVKGVFQGGKKAMAGDYVFERPLDSVRIAGRITGGKFNLTPIKVLIPEGLTKFETAALLKKNLVEFDDKTFIEMAAEGYLFPDTYFFAPNASPANVISTMSQNFNRRIETIQNEIDSSGRSINDLVIMASILETEARQSETRKIISGILWDRYDNDMLLQVDVSWKYINGKNTYELTAEDLAIDSPYNTYKYKGLPPTPIVSPGLDSILAAATPKKTNYVYFMSDRSGEMYYAITFDEHKENRRKYLNM